MSGHLWALLHNSPIGLIGMSPWGSIHTGPPRAGGGRGWALHEVVAGEFVLDAFGCPGDGFAERGAHRQTVADAEVADQAEAYIGRAYARRVRVQYRQRCDHHEPHPRRRRLRLRRVRHEAASSITP